MNQRISIYTPPHLDMVSYYDVVDFAVEVGLSKVEIYNTFELTRPDTAFAQKLRAYADERNVKFVCVSLGINLVEDTRQNIELAKQFAHVAAILGAPYFHHTIALDFEDTEKVAANYNRYYEIGVAAAREIYDYARDLGVRTVVEDQGFIFNGVASFRRFLGDVGRDVGIVADFGNIMFVDERIEPFIQEFSRSIVHVHVKDYIATPKTAPVRPPKSYVTRGGNYLQDCPFGIGAVNFPEALRLLRDIAYTGPISLEHPPVPYEKISIFHKNLQFLEQLL